MPNKNAFSYVDILGDRTYLLSGAPTGFKNVDAQPVGSGASLRKMIYLILITTLYYINDSITSITTKWLSQLSQKVEANKL